MIKRTPIRKVRSKPRPGRVKGKELEALRLSCWVRDNGECQKCGHFTIPSAPVESDFAYHMAHKRGKCMHGDSLDNVEVNCGKCHRQFHAYGPSMEKPCNPKQLDEAQD